MNKLLVDTNVVLRYLLRDNEEQAQIAKELIEGGAFLLPEVLMETSHVLRSFYEVDRQNIATQLLIVLDWVEMERKAVMIRAVEIFAKTKLDFVDCILVAYHELENVEVFTFDRKLNKQLKQED
ncbi:MAG: PIN domain-containing protein [Selenomonadaceae bacterium]|nr:PIN domain-containing protein [Selenomonadaceae bacterium]MBR0101885.1 PIN domain-containing protein [Selenomonadaceae bacterium]